MANILAIADGNFEDASTWSTNTVPGADDNVWLNGHTVTCIGDITIGNLSNRADAETGAVLGGHLHLSIHQYNCTFKQIYATDNIVSYVSSQSYTCTFTCEKLWSLTTKAYSNATRAQQTFHSRDAGGGWYSAYACIWNGDIETDENSVGMVFTSNYTGASYAHLNITGNIIHRGGYISPALSAYGAITGYLTGNMELYATPFQTVADVDCIVVGDIDVYNITFYPGAYMHTGNLTIHTNANANILKYRNYGSIYTYADGSLAQYSFTGMDSNTVITNFYDYSTTSSLFTAINIFQYDLNVHGEFHLGIHQTLCTYNPVQQAGWLRLNAYDNAKIYMKDNSVPFRYININNPDTFEWVYEGDGQPEFILYPYRGNSRLNYPNENTVSDGTTYGVNNEYEGSMQLPQPATVLEGVEYGEYVGTLAPVQGTIVESGTVVNLTEDQIRRIAESITAEMAQTMLQQYFG